jgi:cyclophilin family peptidyl-prolyl cis-trans isomerase/HEAT repeat protein
MTRFNNPVLHVFLALSLAILGCGAPPEPEATINPLWAEIIGFEDRRTADPDRFAALVSDTDPAVRARAALALGRIGDPASVPLLESLMADTAVSVRREAVFAAGISGIADLEPTVRPLLDDTDSEVRGLAAEALRRLDPDAVPETTLDGLEGSEWFRVLHLLARRGDEASLRQFIPLLDDDDPAIRALAAKGLGSAGSKSDDPSPTTAMLAGRLELEQDWLVRVECLAALGRIGAAPDQERFRQALADVHPQVQTAAIRAAGSMAGLETETLDWLATLTGVLEPGVAPDAAQSLARLDDARGAAWGLAASRSAEPLQRAHAAAVLARVEGDEARTALRALLGDESGVVVRGALTAVAGAGRVPEFLEDVTRALMEGEAVLTRAAAAEALGAAGDPVSALPLLLAADSRESKQPSNDCRLSILGLLAEFPENGEVVETVQGALEAGDRLVRQRAVEVMTGWGRQDEIPAGLCRARGKAGEADLDRYRRAAYLHDKRVRAEIRLAAGVVRLELFPADAPLTVLNFCDLAREGYFDGIAFHRVVPGFVVQGGDPEGDGWGGPGHSIRCEYNRLRYSRGMVGMALAGKDTGGSQFFFTLAPQPHLDGRYTIFARVTEGMELVDRIRRGERIVKVIVTVDQA